MIRVQRVKVNRSIGGDIVLLTALALFGSIMALPMLYAISSSLKPLHEIWIFPPKFLVQNPTLKNFKDLLSLLSDSWVPFSRYIFNTLFISIIGTGGHVIIASMCAYALSKHRFYGAKFMFKVIVLSLMFSSAVTYVPTYLVMSRLHLINRYSSLILPAFSSSLGLFLMKQFMESMIPDVVLEAAKIDGAGELRIFFTITMPMVKPAWLTLIVFSFQSLWNINGGIYIQREELKTLNYAVKQIVAGGVARAGAGAASIVFMMMLPIIVFIVTQSNIVETMSASGIKE